MPTDPNLVIIETTIEVAIEDFIDSLAARRAHDDIKSNDNSEPVEPDAVLPFEDEVDGVVLSRE